MTDDAHTSCGERPEHQGWLEWARGEWDEGARHGFPPCCRARWILTHSLPGPVVAFAPEVAARLWRLNPRHILSDGMLPCEYHTARWALTGRHWRTHATTCCKERQALESIGDVVLRHEPCDPEDPSSTRIWMLLLADEDGALNNGVSVHACPWCGTALEAA